MISYLKTKDKDVSLFYRMDQVKNAKANVIINHGFAEHLGRYDYVAKRLLDAGYNVLRYDLRGHGQSYGPKGYIDSYTNFIEDAKAMYDLMTVHNPGLETFMLGHSMGGLVTAMYGLEYPDTLAGQIFSGAAYGKLPAASGYKAKLLSTLAKTSPKLQMKNVVEDDICSVPEVVNEYKNDPLVLKKASFNFYNEFLNEASDFVLEYMYEYDLPCLILHGEDDAIVPVELSYEFYEQIASTDKELITYPGLYHEILNEDEKDEILTTIIEWLDSRQNAGSN